MEINELVDILKNEANPANVEGMARFGIASNNTLGISMPMIRSIAKEIKKDHKLALEAFDTGIHEAKILASLIADPKQMTRETCDKWVKEFDSWDVVDQICSNLWDKLPFCDDMIFDYAEKEEEFVRRTSFVLMACSSVHNKDLEDAAFEKYYPLIIKYATDERNFVKKAVNWAIRQIGKRNMNLRERALELCDEIRRTHPDNKAARWIVSGAERELTSEKTLKTMAMRKSSRSKK